MAVDYLVRICRSTILQFKPAEVLFIVRRQREVDMNFTLDRVGRLSFSFCRSFDGGSMASVMYIVMSSTFPTSHITTDLLNKFPALLDGLLNDTMLDETRC